MPQATPDIPLLAEEIREPVPPYDLNEASNQHIYPLFSDCALLEESMESNTPTIAASPASSVLQQVSAACQTEGVAKVKEEPKEEITRSLGEDESSEQKQLQKRETRELTDAGGGMQHDDQLDTVRKYRDHYRDQESDRYKDQVERANQERDQYKEQMETANQERDRYRDKVERANQERDQYKEQMETANRERDQYKEQMETANQERDQYKEQMEKANQESDRYKDQVATDSQERDRYRDQVETANQERDHYKEQVEKLKQGEDDLLKDLGQSNAERDQLKCRGEYPVS